MFRDGDILKPFFPKKKVSWSLLHSSPLDSLSRSDSAFFSPPSTQPLLVEVSPPEGGWWGAALGSMACWSGEGMLRVVGATPP